MIYNQPMPTTKRTVMLICFLLFLSTIGIFLNLHASRFGMGVGNDSAVYLSGAKSIHATGQYRSEITRYSYENESIPLNHFPPLYPLLLSISEDPFHWARIISAILFALTIFLTGLLCYEISDSITASIAAASLVVFSASMLAVYQMVFSEQAFIPLLLVVLLFHSKYLRTGMPRYAIIAGAFAGVAIMSRLAGYYLIWVGAAAIFMNRGKWRDYAIFLAVSSILPIAWMIRNTLIADSATSSSLSPHLIPFSKIKSVIPVIGSFATPDGWIISGSIIVALIAALTCISRDKSIRLLSMNLILYLLFLAVSISIYDASTPIDGRILSPMIAVIAIVICAGVIAWIKNINRPNLRLAAVVVLSIAALFWFEKSYAINALAQSERGFKYMLRHASQKARTSETIQATKELEGIIYTNSPGCVYFNVDRPIKLLPRNQSRFTTRPLSDAQWRAELDNARQLMTSGYVVFLHDHEYIKEVEDGLLSAIPLKLLSSHSDGKIYRIEGRAMAGVE